MAMRTVTIPSQTIVESIQSYTYNAGASVNVVVGVGNEINGVFNFVVPQQFDFIRIVDEPAIIDPETKQLVKNAITDFSDLMAQYPNGSFTTNDLWPYIDLIRSRRT
jgi:hypothetical protein